MRKQTRYCTGRYPWAVLFLLSLLLCGLLAGCGNRNSGGIHAEEEPKAGDEETVKIGDGETAQNTSYLVSENQAALKDFAKKVQDKEGTQSGAPAPPTDGTDAYTPLRDAVIAMRERANELEDMCNKPTTYAQIPDKLKTVVEQINKVISLEDSVLSNRDEPSRENFEGARDRFAVLHDEGTRLLSQLGIISADAASGEGTNENAGENTGLLEVLNRLDTLERANRTLIDEQTTSLKEDIKTLQKSLESMQQNDWFGMFGLISSVLCLILILVLMVRIHSLTKDKAEVQERTGKAGSTGEVDDKLNAYIQTTEKLKRSVDMFAEKLERGLSRASALSDEAHRPAATTPATVPTTPPQPQQKSFQVDKSRGTLDPEKGVWLKEVGPNQAVDFSGIPVGMSALSYQIWPNPRGQRDIVRTGSSLGEMQVSTLYFRYKYYFNMEPKDAPSETQVPAKLEAYALIQKEGDGYRLKQPGRIRVG